MEPSPSPFSETNANQPHRASKPSVRTSLRTGRASTSQHPVAVALSALALAITTVLVWALASAVPSSASPQPEPEPTADRLAGSDVGLHHRVTAADAAALEVRTAELVEAQQVTAKVSMIASMRAEIVRVARNQLGDPYRAGSAGPHAFDCGGLTQFVFRRALGMDIARSSRGQYQQVERIKKKDARPGDLVFFFERGAHHVGIYIGNGKMIDAPNPGESVRVSPISGSWWSRTYTGMGRMLPA